MPGEGEATRRLNLLMAAGELVDRGAPLKDVVTRVLDLMVPGAADFCALSEGTGPLRLSGVRATAGVAELEPAGDAGGETPRRAAPGRRPRGRRPRPARPRRHPLRRDRAAAGARAHHRLDHRWASGRPAAASAPRTCASSACSPAGSG